MGKPTYKELEEKIRKLEQRMHEQYSSVTKMDEKKKKVYSLLIIDDDDSVRSSLSSYLDIDKSSFSEKNNSINSYS